jgi:hypothetical protein
MRLKLDKNFGRRCVDILTSLGQDGATAFEQPMRSFSDRGLIDAFAAQAHALVTLVLSCASPLVFDPQAYRGIAVVRLPRRPSVDDRTRTLETRCEAMKVEQLDHRLWSIEIG